MAISHGFSFFYRESKESLFSYLKITEETQVVK